MRDPSSRLFDPFYRGPTKPVNSTSDQKQPVNRASDQKTSKLPYFSENLLRKIKWSKFDRSAGEDVERNNCLYGRSAARGVRSLVRGGLSLGVGQR